ncbi:P-loop containing nucleoside triphosphate hydrolase protein [Podospora australis]|uniref:P-loop containing nucleoside triphosphate hydrolase protein n=1 Tax=Podospora australis TaxID=1536484 RepID=A0AAN6WPP9_9PEZI|nr:P-loop containing nucleoside triphosphate hydrolase protein [Podospora australis]
MPNNVVVAAIQTTIAALKLVILILELCPKDTQPGIRQPTPDERASIISRMLIWWLLPLLRLGQQKTALTPDILPSIEHKLTRAGDAKSSEDDKEKSNTRGRGESSDDVLVKPSIFGHIWAVRGWLVLSAIPPRLAYTGFLFAQPFLIHKATNWLATPLDDNTYRIGGGLIGAYAIVYVGLGASQAFYRQCTARAITAVRADLVTKIHSHSLKLSASSQAQDSATTLMSADVERFAVGTRNLHEAWASPIELGIGLFILETQIGVATAAAAGLTVVFIALTGLIAGAAGKRQNEWLKGMEERIAGTTQALKAMRGIKMTGASSVIRHDIMALRRAEVRRMRRFRQVLMVVLWSMFIPVILGPILAFTVYNVYVGPKTGQVLTPAVVYQVLTILGIFGNSIAVLLQSSVDIVTAGASLKRIQDFLLGENTREDKRTLLPGSNSRLPVPEEDEDDNGNDDEDLLLDRPRQPPNRNTNVLRLNSIRRRLSSNPSMLRLSRACAGWSTDGPMVVSNANLEASGPGIVAVVGPTGSGKTTLLRMLLGETEHAEGIVGITSRRIGYCSQTPWLTNASVRENIVGSGGVFDQGWYNTVLQATALHRDISMMAKGDSTIVGNGGSSLSGGQKKRIALARAVYSKAPIFVLDDPFNGLDGRTEGVVLESLFGLEGLLRKRHPALVVWATSEAKQARFADRVITLTESGDVRKRDSLLASLKPQRANSSWLDVESGESGREDQDWRTPKDRPLSTIEIFEGLVVGRDNQHQSSPSETGDDDGNAPGKSPVAYRYYIGGGGRRKFLLFLAVISMFIAGSMVSPDSLAEVWVVKWAQNNVDNGNRFQGLYIGVYFALGGIQLISWSAAGLFFIFVIAEKAADRCHAALLDTVLSAPISFLDSTAAGKTINRFSQDLQLIDTELPYNLLGAVTQALGAIGQCAIIIYGAPWSGIAIPFVAGAVFWLQRAYLPTSRQLRVLEIEAKAPLFSQLLETLAGLPTIRAMRWQAVYARKSRAAIAASQKPFFLLFSAQNWLNLVLDLITAGLAVTIIAVGVATRSSSTSATLGLALFGASSFGTAAKNVIQHYTQLEISMGAIERVRAFVDETASERTSSDGKGSSGGVPDSGLQDSGSELFSRQGQGRITFSGVSARYTPSLPLILRDISFDIRPGQRYAICGRTGSGKSSLLSALLRLLPLEQGQVLLDGVDISTMADPDMLRSRFITLPQDPVTISGSVRHNLLLYHSGTMDASIQPSDDDLSKALDSFGLWETVQSKGGLDAPMTDDLLSHGQRQLFCLARATLLRGRNVVILDEPTSQADKETGRLIEAAVRDRFGDASRTVLCVAHRLSTILEFDTVLVMDGGVIVERGCPRTLLGDSGSAFARLMSGQGE